MTYTPKPRKPQNGRYKAVSLMEETFYYIEKSGNQIQFRGPLIEFEPTFDADLGLDDLVAVVAFMNSLAGEGITLTLEYSGSDYDRGGCYSGGVGIRRRRTKSKAEVEAEVFTNSNLSKKYEEEVVQWRKDVEAWEVAVKEKKIEDAKALIASLEEGLRTGNS